MILDPQFLTKAMATIVSLKNTMVRDGILFLKDCALIWRPPLFPPSLHEPLLKILESFQVLYRLRDASANRSISSHDVSSLKGSDSSSSHSAEFQNETFDFSSLVYATPPLSSQSAPLTLSPPHSSSSRPLPIRSQGQISSPLSYSLSPSSPSLLSSPRSIKSARSGPGSSSESSSELSSASTAPFFSSTPLFELEGKCIIPALLPEDRPLEMKRMWQREREGSDRGRERQSDVIGRVFQFDFLPLGFFSRLMVQLFHLLPPLLYWQRSSKRFIL